MHGKRIGIVAAAALALACGAQRASASFILTGASNDANLLANAIAQAAGITVVPGTATYTGAPLASGFFLGDGDILPMKQGVLLTTGKVDLVPGPNKQEGTTWWNHTPGDADVQAIVGKETFDAAVLEFDFTMDTRLASIRYAFGSDEYEEYATSKYNDGIGIFVNGVNVAKTPGGAPVTVNDINMVSNTTYYTANNLAIGAPANIEYDGFAGGNAVPGLFAVLTPNPTGAANHLKIVIADASDPHLDSGLFLEGILQVGGPDLPEPGVVGVLGVGAAGILGRRRRA